MPDPGQEQRAADAASPDPVHRLRAAAEYMRDMHSTPVSTAEAMYWRNLSTLFDRTARILENLPVHARVNMDPQVQLIVTIAEGYLLSPWLDNPDYNTFTGHHS